jgi:hypothetical protein
MKTGTDENFETCVKETQHLIENELANSKVNSYKKITYSVKVTLK